MWIYGQLVMRGNRILIPEKLRKQILQLAQQGHQGMVRTKSRLREKSLVARDEVEKFIRSCHPCQLVGPRQKPDTIKLTVLSEASWSDLAIDLLEIPGGNHLRVLIDYYSRWAEVVFMTNTEASRVIKCLESIFQTHGLPDTIRSDNRPPFASNEFNSILIILVWNIEKEYLISHRAMEK